MSKKKQLTYDKALTELQDIVTQLQEEIVSMESLSAKAKRAAELVKFCQEKLRKTESEIKTLFEGLE
ncbi:MAG TPA: exodeoxyribonuclease VII small subunit [Bacteroidetes bacterium]|nr:exodeoxyribonuclease VII small subunit [Bacteroidota bacterium]